MTFLIFLLSLAVAEYVVRRSEKRTGDGEDKLQRPLQAVRESPVTESMGTESLQNLMAALERYGCGTLPSAMEEEKPATVITPDQSSHR
jgi:hypothetical protein